MSNTSSIINELLVIENLMTIFFESTGIPCVFVDEKGQQLFANNKKEAFCIHFNKVDPEENVCTHFHHSSGKQANMIGETYISFCPSGMIHFTSAIQTKGDYLGSIVAGPVLFDIPDTYLLRKTLEERKIDIGNMGFLEMYYTQVRVIDVEKARRIRELLDVLAGEIGRQLGGMDKAMPLNKINENEKAHKQDNYSDLDMDQQAYYEVKLHTNESYPIHLEKELLHNIKHSNVIGVRKNINEILGYIYLRCDLSHKEILVLILELVVLMTRAAVDIGVDFYDMTELISNYIESIQRVGNNDDSFEIVNAFLDAFMSKVFNEEILGNNEKAIVQKLTSYIQNNYNTGLTLEEMAAYANMNVSYMSRFFKKHLGMNFSDYVNNIRVEFSKEYLENDRYSIIDVALMMGFTDQSYYSKVFKKYTGNTPGKYRKMVKQVADE